MTATKSLPGHVYFLDHAGSPTSPAPEELMAFGDGEGRADVISHVAACSICAASAADYARAESTLRHSLYRFDCPAAHTLGEYALDLVDPVERTTIAAHATECHACTAELESLRAYLAAPTPDLAESLLSVDGGSSPRCSRRRPAWPMAACAARPSRRLWPVRSRRRHHHGWPRARARDVARAGRHSRHAARRSDRP